MRVAYPEPPKTLMQNLRVTSPINFVVGRYFLRLQEALKAQYPTVAPPSTDGQATVQDFYQAVRKLNREHDLPGLGFEFGCRLRISDYGIVGLAAASTRSLSEALATQLRFLNIITNTSKIRYAFYKSEKWLTLQLCEVDRSRRLDQFTIESELGAQLRFTMDLLPSARMSQCILSLPYDCPTTRAIYRKRGRCQVKFNQPLAQLQLPGAWADKALESADEMLAPMLADRCQMILSELKQGDDWVLRVRNYLLTSDSPKKGLDEVAHALGVSTSNLRWHLSKSRTSYKQILLDIRMQLACQYLEDTPLTIQQMSYQLGYSYHSNFQLAFKKYFKISPGLWRVSKRI